MNAAATLLFLSLTFQASCISSCTPMSDVIAPIFTFDSTDWLCVDRSITCLKVSSLREQRNFPNVSSSHFTHSLRQSLHFFADHISLGVK